MGTARGAILLVDGTIRDLPVVRELEAHKRPICSLACHAYTGVASDTARMASSDEDGLVVVWDTEQFQPLLRLTPAGVPVFGLSVRGDQLLAGDASGHLSVYSLAKGKKLVDCSAHARCINAVDCNAGAEIALSVASDCRLRAWSLGRPLKPDMNLIFAASMSDSLVVGAAFVQNAIAVVTSDHISLLLFRPTVY